MVEVVFAGADWGRASVAISTSCIGKMGAVRYSREFLSATWDVKMFFDLLVYTRKMFFQKNILPNLHFANKYATFAKY